MKTHLTRLPGFVFVVILLWLSGPFPSAAQDSQSLKQIQYNLAPLRTGGPDEFGYMWDDSTAFSWIDAKVLGSNTGLYGDDQFTLPLELGFSFPFYENTYSQISVSTKGLVSFGGGGYWYDNVAIPNQADPNNFIAAFWYDLGMYLTPVRPNAGIYTYQAGVSPDRFFVIEWYQADLYGGGRAELTFEIILCESGDILMQYASLSGESVTKPTIGIEDSTGVIGLQYLYGTPVFPDGKTIRFTRPAASGRIHLSPFYQGGFTPLTGTSAFFIHLRNIGDLGQDTYNLAVSTSWPVSLYAENGEDLLSDTNGDGISDSGPIAQGNSATVVVKLQPPEGADTGSSTNAVVTAQSSLSPDQQKHITIQSTVPAPFAQVYRDDANGAMSLYLAHPAGHKEIWTTPAAWSGYDVAVAETMGGNFLYTWYRGRCLDGSCDIYIQEIEYTLLNQFGEIVRPITKLCDHVEALTSTYDSSPVIGSAPDGNIGILWYRYQKMPGLPSAQYNYNIYFAILDPYGSLSYGPVSLTNNLLWGGSETPDVPRYYEPAIAATGDSRFVLGWRTALLVSGCTGGSCYRQDVDYVVRDTSGADVKSITNLASEMTLTWEGYNYPNLTALTGNQVFFTWTRMSEADIYYEILDSSGNSVKDKTKLFSDGLLIKDNSPDAVQLSDGKILVGWVGGVNIRYLVLDPEDYSSTAPVSLSHPSAVLGNGYLSIAAGPSGLGILTWMDSFCDLRSNLYYALVDSSGLVVTPPVIYRTASPSEYPSIETSYTRQGNTSYSSHISLGVDTAFLPVDTIPTGWPGGYAAIPVEYTNHGLAAAAGVEITAELGSGLAYLDDTSGTMPIIAGSQVIWSLPDLSFLEKRQFILYVSLPPGAAVGKQFPASLYLTADGETNNTDNQYDLVVITEARLFLPIIRH